MKMDFIDFVQSLFPYHDKEAAENIKKIIKQFNNTKSPLIHYFMPNHKELTQGDILETLKFTIYDKTGQEHCYKTKGLLLTNTCDATREDFLLFVPIFSYKKLKKQYELIGKKPLDEINLKKNYYTRFIYFETEHEYDDFEIVDLGIIQTYQRTLITDLLEKNTLNKCSSLNTYGYYLFICKMTSHLLRLEDSKIQNDRLKATPSIS